MLFYFSLTLLVSFYTVAASDVHHLIRRTAAPTATFTAWVDVPTPAVTPGPRLRRQDSSSQDIPFVLQTCAVGPTSFACQNAACGFALAGYMGCCSTYTTQGSYYVPQSCVFQTSCVDSAAVASLDPAAKTNSNIMKCTDAASPVCVTMTVGNGETALWGKMGFTCGASSQTIASPDASYVLGVTLMPAGMTDSFAPLGVSLVTAKTHTATATATQYGNGPPPTPSGDSSSSLPSGDSSSSSSTGDSSSSSISGGSSSSSSSGNSPSSSFSTPSGDSPAPSASGDSTSSPTSSSSRVATRTSTKSRAAFATQLDDGATKSSSRPSRVSVGTGAYVSTGIMTGTGVSGASGMPGTTNRTSVVTYQSPTIPVTTVTSASSASSLSSASSGTASPSSAAGAITTPGRWEGWVIQFLGLLLFL